MKLRQSETSFDLSICSQRLTRSSSGSVRNTKLIKKLPKLTQNNTITSKRGKKSGKTFTEGCSRKEANSIPLDDICPKRRMTRSSSGSVTGSLLKKSKLASEPETKFSKQLKKPNQTLQKNDSGRVKKKNLCTISIPERGNIDNISSVSQYGVKGTKSSKLVSKKKSDVILSESQSTLNLPKSQSVVIERNSIAPESSRRVTRSSLDVISSQSTCNPPKSQSVVSEKKSISPKISRRVTRSGLDVILHQSTCNTPKSQSSIVNEKNSISPKVSRRETRFILDNAAQSLSTQENHRKLSDSPVAPPTDKQVKVKKRQASKEKLSLENGDSKRRTRSSLANANSSSVPLRNKSPRFKPLTKSTALVNPRKQTKKTSALEKENLEFENSSSDSVVDVAPPTRSSPKKAVPEDTHSVQRASRSSKLPNTSVLPTDLDTSQNTQSENIAVRPLEIRMTRLSASVLSTYTDSSSGTRKRSASSRSETSLALETEEKNSPKFKKPRAVKRKSNSPPAVETKRKRKTPSITPASTEEDPVSSQSTSTGEKSKKHTRRHTVDVLPKTKGPKNAPTTQQIGKKKSPTVKGTSVKTLSSRSTPDISLLPIDAISTFTAKRPKSAPAAIKKRSLSKVSTSTIPKKGTLKRKRWLADALKEKNKSYEDDIFENQKFASPFRIPTEADDESDTSIATPKFGFFLTPAVAKRTPKFKDIISPSNLVKARKNAEEYLYRRQNRNKTNKIITLKTPASSQTKASTKLGSIPEKKKLEFVEAMDKMQTIKSTIEAKAAEESDEEDEDSYLSDFLSS